MPITQEETEEMCAVYKTQADRGTWGRWEALYLDLARERKDKSVGNLLSEQCHPPCAMDTKLSRQSRAAALWSLGRGKDRADAVDFSPALQDLEG